jgi:hypothetical protein
MLSDILKQVEQRIMSVEHEWKRKGSFYKYIDSLVYELLDKLLPEYTIEIKSDLKETALDRYVHIYNGIPSRGETRWDFIKDKPYISVHYKVRLQSTEDKTYSFYSSTIYNLKDFTFEGEYNYELKDTFEELTKNKDEALANEREKLFKTREELIAFLDKIKEAVERYETIDFVDKYIGSQPYQAGEMLNSYMRSYMRLLELL